MSFRLMTRSEKQERFQLLTNEQRAIELAKITLRIVDHFKNDYICYITKSDITQKELNDALTVYVPLLREFLHEAETAEIKDEKKLDEVVVWCEFIMRAKKGFNKSDHLISVESERFEEKRIEEKKLPTNPEVSSFIILKKDVLIPDFTENKKNPLHLHPKPHEIKKKQTPPHSKHHQFFSKHDGKKPDMTARREIKQPASFRR